MSIPPPNIRKIRFSLELWDKWRAARAPHPHDTILRAGIEETRASIALQEARVRLARR